MNAPQRLHRQERRAARGRALSHRPRPVHRRHHAAGPDLRRLPAQPARARAHQEARHRGGGQGARRARHLHRRALQAGRRPALRLADQQHRRHADEGAAPPGAGRRQGALRRRPRRAGRRRDARAGQGRGAADRGRLRRAARGGRRRQGGQGRQRGARRGARQPLLPVGHRRQGRHRRGIQERRARDDAELSQQPADPQRDRAARGQRQLRLQRRQLHAVRGQPEPARRAAADVRLRARHPRAQDARGGARCRRRLRLEDLPVRRGDRAGVRQQADQAADQVDGRALGGLPVRRARPRPPHHRQARRSTRTASSSRCASTPRPTSAPTCRPSRPRCRPSCTPRCWPASTRRRRSTAR